MNRRDIWGFKTSREEVRNIDLVDIKTELTVEPMILK